ncbi:pyroglutamyl-peptidase I [Tardiphaga alba]|uniref:Pyrrolidone-carboxylate peptidase n=1 Tax=Tardiphaga alba TaxID=340268 RepID=A0ABX8AA21_9BRAD|nr:pyroglutamyl-peptidase I [Tardiphaga alba]QUS39235.1 pyroglutamyl-peptidase I [Tardiphaga alba]
MSAPRILITGFGPFPGAPVNPTMPLVQKLATLRRPAFADVIRIPHIFDVTYATVDRELPALIARHRPDALLCFGLATRTPHLRIETRARNAVSMLWPDADGTPVRRGFIVPGAAAQMFGPHTARLLQAARLTGVDVRPSRDAGRYLCNYLSWRAIEATRTAGGPSLAAFIHVPLTAIDTTPQRMTTDELTDAGEAILLEFARLARSRRREVVQREQETPVS